MRITGGLARGILLFVPKNVEHLRPATDFLRQAVFSSLGQKMQQALVLDLFSGVGSYGLESLSRGAEACVFVEKNRIATDATEINIRNVRKSVGKNFTTKVFCQDVFAWETTCEAKFDVIFIDPPYNLVETRGQELVKSFMKLLKNSDDSRLILEVPGSYRADDIEEVVMFRRLGRISNSRQPNVLIYGKK